METKERSPYVGMTLREMCLSCGVSRRAVQGYEKHGLICAAGKNPMGHNLYDREAQQKVRQIRQYQKYGYRVREIQALVCLPREALIASLEEKLSLLCQQSRETSSLILELQEEIEKLK